MSERQRHRMIWAQRLAALTLALSTMTAAGCDETLSKIAGPTPTLEPTFSSIRTNIIEAQDSAGRRACVQCHTKEQAPGWYNASGELLAAKAQAALKSMKCPR